MQSVRSEKAKSLNYALAVCGQLVFAADCRDAPQLNGSFVSTKIYAIYQKTEYPLYFLM